MNIDTYDSRLRLSMLMQIKSYKYLTLLLCNTMTDNFRKDRFLLLVGYRT